MYLNFDYSFFIAVRNRKERAMRGDRHDSERSRSRDRKDSRDVRLRLGHRDRDSDRGKLCFVCFYKISSFVCFKDTIMLNYAINTFLYIENMDLKMLQKRIRFFLTKSLSENWL